MTRIALVVAFACAFPPATLAQGERTTHAPSVPPSWYVENLTWPEVRDAIASGRSSAIIYTGSTEQNGPHLALGKHNFIAHYVAGRIAQALGDALAYPTLPFAPTGDPVAKTGHMRFAGSVSVSPEVFLGVVRQVALSAIAAGFRHVLLMGDHGGGQGELACAAEGLDQDWHARGVRVFYVPDLYFKEKEQVRAYLREHSISEDRHAGTDDTSEIMYLDAAGQWIRRDKLAASDSTQQSTTGVDGDPTRATTAIGRIFIDYKVQDAVDQIRQLRTRQSAPGPRGLTVIDEDVVH
jgi:creatinine amidohydrolase